jgi:hypothetical protein
MGILSHKDNVVLQSISFHTTEKNVLANNDFKPFASQPIFSSDCLYPSISFERLIQ